MDRMHFVAARDELHWQTGKNSMLVMNAAPPYFPICLVQVIRHVKMIFYAVLELNCGRFWSDKM